MDKLEQQMINIVNRNHDIKAMADRLNAISARRKRKRKKVSRPWSWNLQGRQRKYLQCNYSTERTKNQ